MTTQERTYKTTTEYAAEIRATLKREHEWTSRQISVRADSFSMGSSIDVVIRDPEIPLATVKAIAEQAERIRRCEYSGEILSGGNRYVSVKYSDEAERVIGKRYEAAAQTVATTVTDGGVSLAGAADVRQKIAEFRLWED